MERGGDGARAGAGRLGLRGGTVRPRVGRGGKFSAAVKTVAEWFPRRERALATGLFNSGANVGAVLAPLLVPWLTLHYGWQMAFIVLGATGFVWLVF